MPAVVRTGGLMQPCKHPAQVLPAGLDPAVVVNQRKDQQRAVLGEHLRCGHTGCRQAAQHRRFLYGLG